MKKFLHACFLLVKNLFSKISKLIDKVIYQEKLRAIVSFLIALGFCVTLYFDEISIEIFKTNTISESLGSIPVQVQIDEDLYEVSGLPDAVAATATGPSADVEMLIRSSSVEVIVDLRNLKEGSDVIDLKPSNVPENVEVELDPDQAQITIEKKVRRSFLVQPEILLGPGQNQTTFEPPRLAQNNVNIIGTEEQIESVRVVKAIIDASGQSASFTTQAAVVAYDSSGKMINGITIMPETIQVDMNLNETNKNETNKNTAADSTASLSK